MSKEVLKELIVELIGTVALHDEATAKRFGKIAKEALAEQPAPVQQEQCPTCGEFEPRTGTCGTSFDDLRALCNRAAPQPAQQQEPSGYIATRDLEVFSSYLTQCQVVLYKAPSKMRTAIYTTPPPQRKPLTTEEIRDWWASENGLEDCAMSKLDDFEKVIRAMEAKHNIKENT